MAERRHPLKIDLVARKVSELGEKDFQSIKNARLVCKVWKDVSEAEWSSYRVPITIVQDEQAQHAGNTMEDVITLSKFLEQQTGPNKPKIPPRNFILKDWINTKTHFLMEAQTAEELNSRFWSLHGKNIHVLTLSGGEFDFFNEKSMEESFLVDLPNLERLTLQNCKLGIFERTESELRFSTVPMRLFNRPLNSNFNGIYECYRDDIQWFGHPHQQQGEEIDDGLREDSDGQVEENDGRREENDGHGEENDDGLREDSDRQGEENDGHGEENDGSLREDSDGQGEDSDGQGEDSDGQGEDSDGQDEEDDGHREENDDDGEENDRYHDLIDVISDVLANLNQIRNGPNPRDGFLLPRTAQEAGMENRSGMAILQQQEEPATHLKLKFICLEDMGNSGYGCSREPRWAKLHALFPNLEEILIRRASWSVHYLFKALKNGGVPGKLQKLDIMNKMNSAEQYCSEVNSIHDWSSLSLKKLTLDCGFKTDYKDVQTILLTQASTVENLQLYRAPFSSTYCSLPCEVEMPNLTELHLWGNVTGNLNFLQRTPQLKVLKWNSSCYTESNHGSRIHEHLNQEKLAYEYNMTLFPPVFNKNVVENTNELQEEFKLDSLTTLEIEWGPTSSESWQKLGSWMPNLKQVKGVVSGDAQFALISKQWPDIEHLQLAHGSSVSVDKIRNVVLTNGICPKLRSFIWKPCPCLTLTADDKEEEEIFTESELRKRVPDTVLPWSSSRLLMPQALSNDDEEDDGEDIGEDVCLQKLFENAIANGGKDIEKFLEIHTRLNSVS